MPSEHKRVRVERGLYRPLNVPLGMHALQIRLAGFKDGTVPALCIVGRRALGTLAMSRLLDEVALGAAASSRGYLVGRRCAPPLSGRTRSADRPSSR